MRLPLRTPETDFFSKMADVCSRWLQFKLLHRCCSLTFLCPDMQKCISLHSWFLRSGNIHESARAGVYPCACKIQPDIFSIFRHALSGAFSFPPSPAGLASSASFSAPCFGSSAPPPRITKPALPARPIELQTSQVMINTNTQQWEQQQPGSVGVHSLSRHTRGCGSQQTYVELVFACVGQGSS